MISAIENATYTVVVSRGQSRNPQKRALEEAIAEAARQLDGVDVVVVPHLYDLPKGSESFQRLAEIEGDLIVLSWIYSRAAHLVLDRNGIRGQVGDVILQYDGIRIEKDDHLVSLVKLTEIGKRVEMVVYRDGRPLRRTVEIGDNRTTK